MFKKHAPRLAIVADIGIRAVPVKPEPRAVPAAKTEPWAFTADGRNVRLHGAERIALAAIQDGRKFISGNIPQIPFGIHVKIAGVAITIMLNPVSYTHLTLPTN